MVIEPYCFGCKWYDGVGFPTEGEEGGEYNYCPAYPKGIPMEIAYADRVELHSELGVTTDPDFHTTVREDQDGEYTYEEK